MTRQLFRSFDSCAARVSFLAATLNREQEIRVFQPWNLVLHEQGHDNQHIEAVQVKRVRKIEKKRYISIGASGGLYQVGPSLRRSHLLYKYIRSNAVSMISSDY